MAFYGSASAILSRIEPRPEDDLRGSCDSVDQLTSSVEYIRDFLQLDEDFSDDESDQEIDFEKFSLPTRAKTSPFVIAQKQQDDRCSVCLERYDESDGKILLPCGHAFCADCLRTYLAMTVKETADFKHQISLLEPGEIGNSVRLVVRTSFGVACPSYKCTGIICADTIHDVADPDTFSRFDRFCLRQTLDDLKTDGALKLCDQCQNGYIQDNCLCSDLDCRERTLRVRTKEEIRRQKRWAFENAKSHAMLGVWMSKSNVKCCPSCYKPIEKNMGCDHMYCIQCKTNFNWSQAPAFGTGAHWWRPDPKKSKPQEDPAPAPVVAL